MTTPEIHNNAVEKILFSNGSHVCFWRTVKALQPYQPRRRPVEAITSTAQGQTPSTQSLQK
ncbi:MAG: hypothetical protein M1812_002615 [Candelaria pacifica]|nr:MAG: hypothetical protein M1812_002615 [Candelaria pacifica]